MTLLITESFSLFCYGLCRIFETHIPLYTLLRAFNLCLAPIRQQINLWKIAHIIPCDVNSIRSVSGLTFNETHNTELCCCLARGHFISKNVLYEHFFGCLFLMKSPNISKAIQISVLYTSNASHILTLEN
jgi:hypothetical protein